MRTFKQSPSLFIRMTTCLLIGACALGCSGEPPTGTPPPPTPPPIAPPPPPAPPPHRIVLDRAALTFTALEEEQTVVAAILSAQDDTLRWATVTWSSTQPSIAWVSGSGLVTSGANGTAIITATFQNLTAQAVVTVRQVAHDITLMGVPSGHVRIDTAFRLSADVRDWKGHPLTTPSILWGSTTPEIATVDSVGWVTPRDYGFASIAAAIDGVTATGTFGISSGLPITVAVTPDSWAMEAGQIVQLVWEVEGVLDTSATIAVFGSSPSVPDRGVVSATGAYSAPAGIPGDSLEVIVRVSSRYDPTAFTEVRIAVFRPSPPRSLIPAWILQGPTRVADLLVDERAYWDLGFDGAYPDEVEVRSIGGENRLSAVPLTRGVWRIAIPTSMLRNATVSWLFPWQATLWSTGVFFIRFRGAGMQIGAPLVVTTLGAEVSTPVVSNPGVQYTDYVINLRIPSVDPPLQGSAPLFSWLRNALRTVIASDGVDAIALVSPRDVNEARNWTSNVNIQGSLGIASYPLMHFFTLGKVFMHELGHQWMVRPADARLNRGYHWSISSLASGIMGFSGSVGQGLVGHCTIERAPGGGYEFRRLDSAATPLELFIMGLLPLDSVGLDHPEYIALDYDRNVNPFFACKGDVVGEVLTMPRSEVLQGHPLRNSQRSGVWDVRVAVVVVSFDRLLTVREMSWFEHLARLTRPEVEQLTGGRMRLVPFER